MRLGIFGGTFDPVHYGHLLLAECCREQLKLEQVWFLPAAVPPHKQRHVLTPARQRLDMLELAIAGHDGFDICAHEVDRGGVNYTADTLEYLLAEDPSRELFFLMGEDSLRDLPNWKDPKRVCTLAIPVAVSRGTGGRREDLSDLSMLAGLVDDARLQTIAGCRVRMPTIELSSSDIRRRAAAGQSIRFRTPRAVEKYIETHGLYQGSREQKQRPA